MSSLAGKLALVTGAGSGIGRAACRILAREGASVISADKNETTASETAEFINKEFTTKHSHLQVDVNNSSSVNSAVQLTLKTYQKPPSIIVNAAGITRDNFLLKISEEDFDEVIDVNLKGTFLVMRAFAQAITNAEMKGASIINIASIVGKYGNLGQVNYAASKAGVIVMTKVACQEFAKFGIRCNSILPGFIDTPMTRKVPSKVIEKITPLIPAGRVGQPEEIAEVIAFLASDKSSYVNGAAIDVTGGY